MARDKTARENETESLLDRRSYLKMAGAAAASVAAVGASTGSVDAASYDTIKVPAGGSRSFSLGDGDTLENKLIDISASGATFTIRASGSGWTIRNVGIKGHLSGGHTEPFIVQGDGTIENVYLGDGGSGGATGIFVFSSHSGHIDMNRINVQGWTDNGVYGSAPGNGPEHKATGGQGTIAIENSYSAGNRISNFRLGTDGSYLKNCVMEGGDHRSFWGYYADTKLVDCDVTGAHLVVGENAYQTGAQASVTAENCRYDVSVSTATSSNEFHGNSQGTPDTSLPAGTPASAEEAASGATSAPTDSTTEEPTNNDSEPEGTVLELVADENASNVSYEFTVEGSVAKRTSGSDNVAENNDTITDNDDGTMTVSGVSGNGYGDAFYVNGVVTSMDLDESQWTLRYDGEPVAADDIVFSKKLVIDGSNRPRVASTYTFEVSGTAIKSEALGSINSFDTVEEGSISGRTVGGKDGYRFSGRIIGFSIDGPANVHVQNDS